MSKYRVEEVSKCSKIDNKHFIHSQQYDKDIKEHKEDEQFKIDLRDLILSDPSKIEERYTQSIEVLMGIKKEFGI